MAAVALVAAWVGSGALASATPASLEPAWRADVDAGGFDLAQGVALAPTGDAFVVGTTESEAGRDLVLAMLDKSGAKKWSVVMDRGPEDRGDDVAVDREGKAYVVGTMGTRVGDDVILARYTPEGVLDWSRVFDKGTSEAARALHLDPDGNLLLAGSSLSAFGADAFVAKLAPDGTELWSRVVNLYFVDEGFGVTSDGEGNVIMAGRVLRDGQWDLLVRKWSPEGDLLWSRLEATQAAEEGRGVAADAEGGIHVFGTSHPADEDADADALLVSFSPEGETVASRTFDLDGGNDEGRDVAFDASGNLVLAGFCVCDGTKDPFVLKVAPDGTRIWRSVVPGEGIDGVGAVSVSADGARIVAAGASERAEDEFDLLALGYNQGAPVAFFRRLEGPLMAGTPVGFEDLSAALVAPLAERVWDFGDGNASRDAKPLHTYAAAGDYVVTLTVVDGFRNKATHAQTFHVDGPPLGDAPATGVPGAVVDDGPPDAGPAESSQSTPAPGLAAMALAVLVAVLARRR